MSETSFRRGDAVVCSMQGDFGKPRPAIVVQSDLFNPTHTTIVVCPMTSVLTGLGLFRVRIDASDLTGLRNDSEIMIDKVSAIEIDRVARKIGRLSSAQMELVDRALRLWLDLPPSMG